MADKITKLRERKRSPKRRIPDVSTGRCGVYGPYRHGHKWRVHVRSGGSTTYQAFETFGDASAYVLAKRKPVASPKVRQKRGASWVYFIRCLDDNGHIKIGYAREPGKRITDLQMGCPYELELLAEFRTPQPSLFEAEIHERFSHLRVRGEWFRSAPELLELINLIPSRAEMVREVLAQTTSTADRADGNETPVPERTDHAPRP